MEEMSCERMPDKERQPTEKEIIDYLGKEAAEAWDGITSFLADNYNFAPETIFGGSKYGWAVRYRRSGKSLCTLHPEKGAFTVLVVLGKAEVEQALAELNNFTPRIAEIITSAKQYHDGRWLWIHVLDRNDTADIRRLLQIKKKPRRIKS
jgi:hypothetical protein